MKRFVAVLAGVVLVPLVGFVPPAGSVGLAPCVISGTISFLPPGQVAADGVWRIGPAAITCYGIHQGPEYFLGQGPFSGSGTFTILPSGAGSCLNQIGEGQVEYEVPTSGPGPTMHVKESSRFILAGAGKFSTPSLNGSLVVTPHDGDCLTAPVTRATFVAKTLLVRELPGTVGPGAHRGAGGEHRSPAHHG